MSATAINVLAPLAYMGISQSSPYGDVIDTSFNILFVTLARGTQKITIDCPNVWFLHSIYIYSPGTGPVGSGGGAPPAADTIFIRPYDGEGDAIFNDFFLANLTGFDPFPLLPPIPFQPNDILNFDYLDLNGGNSTLEVAFRGYQIGSPSPAYGPQHIGGHK